MGDEDLLVLGEWLQQAGKEIDKTPIGMAATCHELAFATSEQGWLLPYGAWSVTAQSMLKRLLFAEANSPALAVRATGLFIDELHAWFPEGADGIIPSIVLDMSAVAYTIGRPVAQGLTALKDALDCAVVGPTMAIESGAFYRNVALPLVRHHASSVQVTEDMKKWTLTYDWLLFKVLAYLTRDPTTTQWLEEEYAKPLTSFAAATGLETAPAGAFLLWMVCGEDLSVLSQYYPDWAAYMPESPQMVKAAHIDKNLPNLRLGLIRMLDQCAVSRRSSTLYGRRSPWGLTAPQLLHFSIMGSIDDILDVVSASLMNMGGTTHRLLDSNWERWNRAIITGFTTEEPREWEEKVETLAKLNDPLGAVKLAPKVSVSV